MKQAIAHTLAVPAALPCPAEQVRPAQEATAETGRSDMTDKRPLPVTKCG
ncbi:hypothetical protein I5E68_17835 [Novosphingobium sp. YJ-S2-02]|uniref:Uncharacterized protein n=1 Tax=Novosphingobium aureum TaxID=2792964 RepID=A0A931HFE0_9SPHN|nr:hypothetical protein [Novosphingobium aureum]MBH0114812.1 hypothetical protein [Novosphingobium aureum]